MPNLTLKLTDKANPEFAAAIQAGGTKFRDMVRMQEQNMRAATEEKQRQTEVRLITQYCHWLTTVAQRRPVRH